MVLELVAAVIGAELEQSTLPDATAETEEPMANAFGEYCDITLEQTRSIASFPLMVPDEVPVPFVLSSVDLQHGLDFQSSSSEEEAATAEAMNLGERGDPDRLALTYFIDGATGPTQAVLTQSPDAALYANSPLNDSSNEPDAAIETLTIGDVEVKRVSYNFGSGEQSSSSSAGATATIGAEDDSELGRWDAWYGWSVGDQLFLLNATIDGPDAELVTDAEVEALIASFIAES